MALDSMVSSGCIVSGGHINRSLLFSKVTVEAYAQVENAVILPGVHIGKNSRLSKVIVDEGCMIAANTVIGENSDEDAQRFYLSPQGVALVTADMLGQKNSVC